MAYRRPRRDHQQAAQQRAWIDTHALALRQIGLPPVVYLDYDHWADFLENGHIHFHEDTTHFTFDQLSLDQQGQLRAFLEQHYGHEEPIPPLLGFLRVRLERPG